MTLLKTLLLALSILALCDARSESRLSRSADGSPRGSRSRSRSRSSSERKSASKEKRSGSSSKKGSRGSNGASKKGSRSYDGNGGGNGNEGGNGAGQYAPNPAPVTPAPVTPAPVTPAPVTPAPVTPAPTEPVGLCCAKDPADAGAGCSSMTDCDSDQCVLVDGDKCPTPAPTEPPVCESECCGDADCSGGELCCDGECKHGVAGYMIVSSGPSCEAAGYTTIATGQECEAAANTLSYDWKKSQSMNNGWIPSCYFNPDLDVYFNTNTDVGDCGAYSNDCICLDDAGTCPAVAENNMVAAVGGLAVNHSVNPLQGLLEDQNLVYLVAAGTMGILVVGFYAYSRKGPKEDGYKELVDYGSL